MNNYEEPGTLKHRDWLLQYFCQALDVSSSDNVPLQWREDVHRMMEDLHAALDGCSSAAELGSSPGARIGLVKAKAKAKATACRHLSFSEFPRTFVKVLR